MSYSRFIYANARCSSRARCTNTRDTRFLLSFFFSLSQSLLLLLDSTYSSSPRHIFFFFTLFDGLVRVAQCSRRAFKFCFFVRFPRLLLFFLSSSLFLIYKPMQTTPFDTTSVVEIFRFGSLAKNEPCIQGVFLLFFRYLARITGKKKKTLLFFFFFLITEIRCRPNQTNERCHLLLFFFSISWFLNQTK